MFDDSQLTPHSSFFPWCPNLDKLMRKPGLSFRAGRKVQAQQPCLWNWRVQGGRTTITCARGDPIQWSSLKEQLFKKRVRGEWRKAASRWWAGSTLLTLFSSLHASAAAAPTSAAAQILTVGVKGKTFMTSLWHSKGIKQDLSPGSVGEAPNLDGTSFRLLGGKD